MPIMSSNAINVVMPRYPEKKNKLYIYMILHTIIFISKVAWVLFELDPDKLRTYSNVNYSLNHSLNFNKTFQYQLEANDVAVKIFLSK